MSSSPTPTPQFGAPLLPRHAAPSDLRRAYAVCVDKARTNIRRLADAPKSGAFAKDGDYFGFKEGFFEISNWTSSFFTGMALLAFESTGDGFYLAQLGRLKSAYWEKITVHRKDTMHDLGFLYTLYSRALFALTNDEEHRQSALAAADELAGRFISSGGYLRAWGRMDEVGTAYDGLAIVDSLMNLPLLFWSAKESGNPGHHQIAVRHADTMLAQMVRPDDSVRHAFQFDPVTGLPRQAENFCGFNVDSQWARGTAWAIYGFALVYRYTSETVYLEAALRISRRFIAQLDAEIIPVWDFRLLPAADKVRDSSAAAIAACAFYELLTHRPGETWLATAADSLLSRLCSDVYLDSDPARPGVLRFGQVGDGVGKARTAYTIWGDYFFMESLARRLHGRASYW